MEGILQSFKFKNPERVKSLCIFVGIAAKAADANKTWGRVGKLYWLGVKYRRRAKEYQKLLTRASDARSRSSLKRLRVRLRNVS